MKWKLAVLGGFALVLANFCHHLVPVLLLRQEFYADCLKRVKTLDLVLLVHGCTLSYLALNLN